MDLTKLTFKEIEAELNKAIQDFEPNPSHEGSWVRDSMIEYIQRKFSNHKITNHLTTGGELTITLPGTIEVFGKPKKYKLGVIYKVKTKRTGKTAKVGRIKRKYVVTKADNPFKYHRIDRLTGELSVPCFSINNDEEGNVINISKEGNWSSGYNFGEVEGVYDVSTLEEFSDLIKADYELNVHNAMVQPIVKRIAFTREGDKDREHLMSVFSREHLEEFFKGAKVKDICTPIVEHMKANNLLND